MASESDHHHRFSENYMVLRPKDVSLYELICVLWNNEIEKKAFVDYPQGKEENLQQRRRIFFSLLSQKIFQSVAKPLSCFGSAFEMWLNLISSNPNIFNLFFNALRGKVVMPVKESERFMSTLGHIDKRVHLDKNIRPGDYRYYASLSAMASKLAFENRAFVQNVLQKYWKMELIEHNHFWNDFQRKHTTEAIMFHDKNAETDIVVVAFRGTEPFDADAWCTDFDISWYELNGIGKVHGGFMKALGLLMYKGWPKNVEQEDGSRPIAYYTIREKLKEIMLKNDRTEFILSGHSMGGALAILFVGVLAMHEESDLLKRLEGVYTFGQPRVGDYEFKTFMKTQLVTYGFKYLRFVYCNDVVPRCPTDGSNFLFKHFGTCIYYDSCYNGKMVREEPYKNYLSAFAPISRFVNAVWELLRSFLIPYMKGPEYVEGVFLKLIRLYGLIFPGMAAHNPQDYVNITRLGSESLYLQLQHQHFRSTSDFESIKKDEYPYF
ncbi:triacylglycerol lipase OBL1-like [Euphorbia lathyris]|uniref:triacylglycerol lipase OBL1-like n=1 Tax=Euphorbia lathyris TaxID=212925 RepID=UPI003313C270